MLPNEIEMLKSVPMYIDDKHIMIVSEQYHAEKTPDGRRNKDKSMYRWFAKIKTVEAWNAYIKDLFSDEKRLEKHIIPNDTCGYDLCVNKSTTNGAIADWLTTKIKKVLSWEDGQKKLKGWKNKTSCHDECYDPNIAYDTDGYIAENGDTVDLTNKDVLLNYVDQNLIKRFTPKKKIKTIA